MVIIDEVGIKKVMMTRVNDDDDNVNDDGRGGDDR